METTLQNDNPFQPAQPARPQFLTVICVLSFIMCALSFVGSVWNIIKDTPENMEQSIEQMRTVSPQMADNLEQMMIEKQNNTYMQISNYLNMVYMLLSFMGVMMMWKLNKKGFYIYLAGELLPYIGFIIAWKPMMAMMSGGGMMPAIGPIMVVLMLVFDIAFFIMYAVNLKYMK